MGMADLWWVLIVVALLGLGAGGGLWWRQRARREMLALMQACEFVPAQLSPPCRESGTNEGRTVVDVPTTPQSEYLSASEDLEKRMWRPPPRASLLQRQQIKTRLGNTPDRTEGGRAVFDQASTASRKPLPPFPKAEPAATPKAASAPLLRPADALAQQMAGSGIGRQRKGLESLVTAPPDETTTESRNESRTS